jgi:hypothetical protein
MLKWRSLTQDKIKFETRQKTQDIDKTRILAAKIAGYAVLSRIVLASNAPL